MGTLTENADGGGCLLARGKFFRILFPDFGTEFAV